MSDVVEQGRSAMEDFEAAAQSEGSIISVRFFGALWALLDVVPKLMAEVDRLRVVAAVSDTDPADRQEQT